MRPPPPPPPRRWLVARLSASVLRASSWATPPIAARVRARLSDSIAPRCTRRTRTSMTIPPTATVATVITQRATGALWPCLDQHPGVQDPHQGHVENAPLPPEEEEREQAHPDVEEAVEARIVAVVDGPGDHEGPAHRRQLRRPGRKPAGAESADQRRHAGDADVAPDRAVVELRRMGQKQREGADARAGEEEGAQREPHGPGVLDRRRASRVRDQIPDACSRAFAHPYSDRRGQTPALALAPYAPGNEATGRSRTLPPLDGCSRSRRSA